MWWVAGLQWQCPYALVWGQPNPGSRGSGGWLFCGEIEEAESRAAGALSET